MYVFSGEGLGDAPPIPPDVQAFLDKIRKENSAAFERILLGVALNRNTEFSELNNQILLFAPNVDARAFGKKLLGPLETTIEQRKKQDPKFDQKVRDEVALRVQWSAAVVKLGPDKLGPFILDAWLGDQAQRFLAGMQVAEKMLPASLLQAIQKSQVPFAHFVGLGEFLLKLANDLLSKNPEFKTRAVAALKDLMIKKTKEALKSRPKKLTGVWTDLLVKAALSTSGLQADYAGALFSWELVERRLYDLTAQVESEKIGAGIWRDMGQLLFEDANRLRRKDPAFARLVEQERKRRAATSKKRKK
jgi:hypothetical protein